MDPYLQKKREFELSLDGLSATEMLTKSQEAKRILESEYQSALIVHQQKLSSLVRKEQAAENRVNEMDSMSRPGGFTPRRMITQAIPRLPAKSGPPQLVDVVSEVEARLAENEMARPLTVEERLRFGLPMILAYDHAESVAVDSQDEEDEAASLMHRLAAALAKLQIFEFTINANAELDESLKKHVDADGASDLDGRRIVETTLRNGFYVEVDGEPFCLRKAKVTTSLVNA